LISLSFWYSFSSINSHLPSPGWGKGRGWGLYGWGKGRGWGLEEEREKERKRERTIFEVK